MKQLKKIITAVTILFREAFLFMKSLLMHLALPGRKRKGNILSSIFVFFVGVVELLSLFEKEVFQMAAVFKQRHIRKGIIAITAFLFLLSSVEWTYRKEDKIHNPDLRTEQLQSATVKSISHKVTAIVSCLKKRNVAAETPPEKASHLTVPPNYSSSVARYLLVRSLLI